MSSTPLLVFDTNILMDIWLGRDKNTQLLVGLIDADLVQLVIPEYVLFEFRGTATRWVRDERAKLATLQSISREWARADGLSEPANSIREAAKQLGTQLDALAEGVEAVHTKLRQIAIVTAHTPDLHFRGDLRFLQGLPPDRPRDGIKDCRIYEAVLDIAKDDANNHRRKFLVTKDKDFDYPSLKAELGTHGFEICQELGWLFGELARRAP